jgi:RNase P subunit RPR2
MAEEVIRIMCPNLTCRKVLAVPESARGKTVRCRNCGTNIRIPAAPAAAGAGKTDKKT